MKNEVQLRHIRWGIQSKGSDVALNTLPTLSCILGLNVSLLLTRSSSRSAGSRRSPSSGDNYSYLLNIFRHAMDDELVPLARYVLRAFVVLALVSGNHWEAHWSDQQRAEK